MWLADWLASLAVLLVSCLTGRPAVVAGWLGWLPGRLVGQARWPGWLYVCWVCLAHHAGWLGGRDDCLGGLVG